MDVLLLTTSISLFPIQNGQSKNRIPKKESKWSISSMTFTTRITICLSACLFSLCFLETIPSSWFLFLHKHPTLSIWTISFFYKAFLWAYCVWISIVIPIWISRTFLQHLNMFLLETIDNITHHIRSSNQLYIKPFIFLGRIFHFFGYMITYMLCKSQISIWSFPKRVLQSFANTYVLFIMGSIVGITSSFLCLNCLQSLSALTFHITDADMDADTATASVTVTATDSNHALPFVLSRISNVGILLSTLLNGFGSVSLPYSFFMAIYMKHMLTPSNLKKKQTDLLLTQQYIQEKQETLESFHTKKTLSSTKSNSNSNSNSNSKYSSSWNIFFSNRSNTGGNPQDKKILALSKEIHQLKAICAELQYDISETKQMMSASQISIFGMQSLGKLFGLIFTIILWLRISNAIYVCFQTNNNLIQSKKDLISISLNWLIQKEIMVQEQYNIYSQCFSFLLTFYLSISQITTFSRMISSVKRKWQSILHLYHTQTKDSKIMVIIGDLLLNIIMGSYFLSCIVVMKMTLPTHHGKDFWEALGGADVHLDTQLTNKVFLISVFSSSMALLWTVRMHTDSLKKHDLSSMAFDSFMYFGSGV